MSGFSWSYSSLKNAETCAKRYYHYNVAKDVKEPESDELREGNALHKHFEARLIKKTPLPLGYGQYEALLSRFERAPGKAYGEQKLAITSSFTPSSYFGKDVWFRTVLDFTKVSGATALIVDWKSGKPKEDLTQLQLMAAAMFAHAPAVQRVKSALVFVAHDDIKPAEFAREDLSEIWAEILPRVRWLQKLRETQSYPPKPGGLCRKYCAVQSCAFFGRGG